MQTSVITGTGHYVPTRVVSNHDLAERCNTSDEWVQERTGIVERRYIEAGETASTMGTEAARDALSAAGRRPDEVDCIIFATLSPDYCFPGSGCFMQAQLGLAGVPAFDLRNQCSGFLYGLQMADAFIRSERYRCVLLVGAEAHSTGLDFSPEGRDVTVLFGDGAGAVVMEPATVPDRGLIDVSVSADGRYAKELWCEGPSSATHPTRINHEMLDRGVQWPKMRGRVVFRHAVRQMRDSIAEIVTRNGYDLESVNLLVPHQANLRICEMVAKLLEFPLDRVVTNIERYGNTTAASIPIALDEAVRAGRLKRGDLVALAAFGSGFTWGAALMRW